MLKGLERLSGFIVVTGLCFNSLLYTHTSRILYQVTWSETDYKSQGSFSCQRTVHNYGVKSILCCFRCSFLFPSASSFNRRQQDNLEKMIETHQRDERVLNQMTELTASLQHPHQVSFVLNSGNVSSGVLGSL